MMCRCGIFHTQFIRRTLVIVVIIILSLVIPFFMLFCDIFFLFFFFFLRVFAINASQSQLIFTNPQWLGLCPCTAILNRCVAVNNRRCKTPFHYHLHRKICMRIL
eukprot:1116883_1